MVHVHDLPVPKHSKSSKEPPANQPPSGAYVFRREAYMGRSPSLSVSIMEVTVLLMFRMMEQYESMIRATKGGPPSPASEKDVSFLKNDQRWTEISVNIAD